MIEWPPGYLVTLGYLFPNAALDLGRTNRTSFPAFQSVPGAVAEVAEAVNMKLSPTQSLAGILEPVFAIRTESDLGIGDTDGVRQMIDWCHRHKLNVLQTLPIN